MFIPNPQYKIQNPSIIASKTALKTAYTVNQIAQFTFSYPMYPGTGMDNLIIHMSKF